MRKPETALSVYTGNAGTREQAKQYVAFRRSLINQRIGNKGTQLSFIKGRAPCPVPTKKDTGTEATSGSPDSKGVPAYPAFPRRCKQTCVSTQSVYRAHPQKVQIPTQTTCTIRRSS